jgi:hypothetical protein
MGAAFRATARSIVQMNIPALIDDTVMQHLALYGCCKNLDPYALHMLKTSEHPILRFRRDWMRREALKQHLEAERNQKKLNDGFKRVPLNRGSSMRQSAVIDQHLNAEMLHYSGAQWQDKGFMRDVKAEAPAIFPKRE